MQLNDLRFQALRDQGFTGSTNDMLLQWLQANGATSGQLNDAWSEMLVSKGFSLVINDGWYALLGDLGYEGQINDRELAFWSDGGLISTNEWYIESRVADGDGAIPDHYGMAQTGNGAGALPFGSLTPGDLDDLEVTRLTVNDTGNNWHLRINNGDLGPSTLIDININDGDIVGTIVWNDNNAYTGVIAGSSAYVISNHYNTLPILLRFAAANGFSDGFSDGFE